MNQISKFQESPKKDDRKARAITAGLSATGAAAGAAGLTYAGYKLGQEYNTTPKSLSRVKRLTRAASKEKFGAALIPLEVAGLGGEIMATHILHGDTKKTSIAKGVPSALRNASQSKDLASHSPVAHRIGENMQASFKALPQKYRQMLGDEPSFPPRYVRSTQWKRMAVKNPEEVYRAARAARNGGGRGRPGFGREIKTLERHALSAMDNRIKKADDSLSSCLSNLLADVMRMYKMAHLAHWNVTGVNFASMHEFFGDLYSDVYESIDPIAENMRKLGVDVPASALNSKAATISGSDPISLCSQLLQVNAVVECCLQEAFDCADGHDGLQNFLAERIDAHAKWAWQLRSICGGVSKSRKSDRAIGLPLFGAGSAAMTIGVPYLLESSRNDHVKARRLEHEALRHDNLARHYDSLARQNARLADTPSRIPSNPAVMANSKKMQNTGLIHRAESTKASMESKNLYRLSGKKSVAALLVGGGGLASVAAGAHLMSRGREKKPMFDPRNGAGRRIVEGDVEKAFENHPRVKGGRAILYANGRSYSPDTYYVVHEGKTAILRRPNITANLEPSPETLKRLTTQAARDGSDVYAGVRPARFSRQERRELAELAAGKKGKKKHRGMTAYVSRRSDIQVKKAGNPLSAKRVISEPSARTLALGDVSKARGYFDPEADRQRRMGLYSGAALGGAVVAGHHASTGNRVNFIQESAREGEKTVVRRGVKATKGGLIATGAAAALGAGSVGIYRRGVSRKNQPWT